MVVPLAAPMAEEGVEYLWTKVDDMMSWWAILVYIKSQWIKVVLMVDRTKDMRAKVLEGVARNLMRVSLA